MSSHDQPPITVEERGELLITTYYGAAADAQYRAHLEEMDALVESNLRDSSRRWAVIVDASRWLKSTARQRQMHAEWMKRHEEVMRGRTAGIAFVIESALVRGGLTAVLWLAPLPCPHVVVKTLDDAIVWCEQKLCEMRMSAAR
mgnify:FL=1